MRKRRCPSEQWGESWNPSLSGPRWATAWAIRRVSGSPGCNPPFASRIPQIPHMAIFLGAIPARGSSMPRCCSGGRGGGNGAARGSLCSPAEDHNFYRLKDDEELEHQRQMFNEIQVVTKFFLGFFE